MIRNASMFSQEEEGFKPNRKLMISKCYENIKFSPKKLKETGEEVKVIKDFHIQITYQGKEHILEYSRGEVLDIVRKMFKKYIYLGDSPGGNYIICEIDEDFFKVL